MTSIVMLGFWAPWIETWGIGRRIPLLEWLALELSRLGLVHFTAASSLVTVGGALIAALAATLRIWGTAYLGSRTVNHLEMKAGAIMADGPYRYLRNPLYLGSWCMFVAFALLMPPTGALFALVLLSFFLLRLIRGEEAFLTGQLGEPYCAYLRQVPRLIPHLRSNLPGTAHKPHWMRAVLSELNPIGVFLIWAVLPWRYDNWLMVQAILISFGISLVVRALIPPGGLEH